MFYVIFYVMYYANVYVNTYLISCKLTQTMNYDDDWFQINMKIFNSRLYNE